jgi:tetratricopeptide (TPR) repeat protein
LDCARHAYQVLILRLGPNSPEVCDALYRLGTIEVSQNKRADGIGHLNEALAIYRQSPGQIGLANGAWIASQLLQAYLRHGDNAGADRISRELLQMTAGPLPAGHRYEVLEALSNAAEAFIRYPREPRYAAAEPLFRRAYEIARDGFGQSDATTLELMLRLAQNLADQGRNADAVTLMDRAMALCNKQASMLPGLRSRLYRAYGRVLVALRRLADANDAFERSEELAAMAAAR